MKKSIIIIIVLWPIIICSQDFTEDWNGGNTTWTSTVCDITITSSVSGLQNDAFVNFSTGFMGCDVASYSSNSIVNRGALAPYLDFGNNGKGILTFTFSSPVTNPVLHIDRLGGGYGFGPRANSALLTLLTPNLTLTRLSGNGVHFEVTPNTITRTPDQLFGPSTTAECGTPIVGGAAGSVQIEGNVTTVSFEYELNGAEGFADAIEIVWEVNCDFDQDGISDNIDLDDDNDGILDSTELGNNLLLDSDNDGQIDSKDYDSDGDGCNDVLEAGFTDIENDGVLGSLPNTVNSDGLIINELDGYTNPLDYDNNGIFEFQEDTSPIILAQPTHLNSCEGTNVTIGISLQNPRPIQWQLSTDDGLTWVDLTDNDIYKGVHLENLEILGITLDFNNFQYRAKLEFCSMPILSETMTLSLLKKPDAGIDGNRLFCVNDSPENLIAALGGTPDTTGTWSPTLSQGNGIFDPSIDVAGRYTYRVSNGSCPPSESVVIVEVVQKPAISNIDIVEFSDNNSISIEVAGDGSYKYSIDGIDYQEHPIFDKLEPNNYMLYVKDTRGCEITTTTAVILGYPKFFTPNNDGHNDHWNIKGVSKMGYALSIYDRYGKLLRILDKNSTGWDGKHNNADMPSSDYWFKLLTIDGRVKTGHFSLKR